MRKVAEAVIEGTMGTDTTGNAGNATDTGKAADAEQAD